MSDLEARLLAQIIESPGDLVLRQVYADLLLDRGDPRGELIALQLAGRDPDRAAQLVAAHAERWIAPLLPWVEVSRCRFDHGFLDEVAISPAGRDLGPAIGLSIWATVRTVHLGRLAGLRGPERSRLLRSATALIAHPVMRSLVAVTGDGESLMIERDADGRARFVPRLGAT